MHEIDTAAEEYLKLFQTYMIEIFCENKQLLAHNSNESSVMETGMVLNTPLSYRDFWIEYLILS